MTSLFRLKKEKGRNKILLFCDRFTTAGALGYKTTRLYVFRLQFHELKDDQDQHPPTFQPLETHHK